MAGTPPRVDVPRVTLPLTVYGGEQLAVRRLIRVLRECSREWTLWTTALCRWHIQNGVGFDPTGCGANNTVELLLRLVVCGTVYVHITHYGVLYIRHRPTTTLRFRVVFPQSDGRHAARY